MSIQKTMVEKKLTGIMVDIQRMNEELKKKQKELRELVKKQMEEEDKTLFEALNKKQDRV